MQSGIARIETTFDLVFDNLPNKIAAGLLRVAILPLGRTKRGPNDRLVKQTADILMQPGAARDRLVDGVYIGGKDEAIGRLLDAFDQVLATQPIHDRLKKQHAGDWKAAHKRGLLSDAEAASLEAADKAVAEVIAVDDFPPEALAPRPAKTQIPAKAKPGSTEAPMDNAQEEADPALGADQVSAVLH